MPMPSNVAGGELVLAAWGNNVVESLPPVGFIGQWPGSTPPVNWRICDGTALSRATFADLWALFQTSGAHLRYGQGDGSSTFNLPNYRGRYPIGVNSGGSYFTVGVGEVFGNKDAIVPSHQHGMENHYHDLNNHQHYVNLNTGGFSNNHYHHEQLGTLIRHNPYAPQHMLRVGGELPIDSIDSSSFTTGWADQDHWHNVQGWAGTPNINNTGWATGHNTMWAGSDTTNANLPPSLSVHFIIRVS